MNRIVRLLLVASLAAALSVPLFAASGTYYFTGDPADQVNKQYQDIGTATFTQAAPTGTVPITQVGSVLANADFVGNALASFWNGPFSGNAVGTLHLKWYWSTQHPEALLSGGTVEVTVFADPDWAADREQPNRIIGRALVPLVGIGATPTLLESYVPVNGTVTRELVIQVVPHFADTDEELLVHYGATLTPSQFEIIDGPARQPFPTAPQGSGLAPRFTAFTPSASQLASGLGTDAGEPSIGSNWLTGKAFFQSYLTTFRVAFDDSCPASPSATWTPKSSIETSQQSFDPILYTDSQTGRTLVSQLILASTTSLSAYTDDDGETWSPSQGSGIASGIDHQTIGGGGPFHAPLPSAATYPHAIYYCAQDSAAANCAISLDGGRTYGPAVPIYTSAQCGGLHGHVKVGPDGTAYVPNKGCGVEQALIVSENNGATWEVRKVKGSLSADSDPSVALSKNGRLYFAFADNNNDMVVAVSDDRGKSFTNVQSVSGQAGLKNVVFAEMVAGDDDRAAVAYLGTSTPGALTAREFGGVWHGYISTTYDGGLHWQTVNATPNDPVQRGPIWLSGGGEVSRNLLDFNDATIDKEGRILFGFADGCIGGCAQTGPTARGNSYSAIASIIRQSGGRRMFAQYDPQEPTIPGAPTLTVTRNGNLAKLTWSEGNDGGSPVTKYSVYRNEKLIATTSNPSYVDASADPNTTYTYRVAATNALGTSCGGNAVSSAPAGSSCSGVVLVTDAAGDQTGAPLNGALDIQSVSISEPYDVDGSQKLMFRIKVGSLQTLPANAEWRVLWNFPIGAGGQWYADMRTNESGVPSFEYGRVEFIDGVVTSVGQPVTIGAADAQSNYDPNGTITIVLNKADLTTDAAQFPGPQPGDIIGGALARTYIGTGTQLTTFRGAIDTTSLAQAYVLVGNDFCAPAVLTAFEDDDAHIAYSNGWHTLSDTNATAAHFRMGSGKSTASISFTVPANKYGAVLYRYATAPKGGTGEVFIDGVSQGTINFNGATGTTKNPTFGAVQRFSAGLQPGAHTFEIRGNGTIYLDQIALESSESGAVSQTGPGATTTNTSSLAIGQELVQQLVVPAGAKGISVVAEASNNLPVRVILVSPTGVSLATADTSSGLAVINQTLSGGGVYLVKLVNLSVGPVNVWTSVTPLVSR
ncbi:MAG TPA: hypothetical protein VF824_22880 [Thermoanaerobaculia bacterium]|jgi:hypothetical protein